MSTAHIYEPTAVLFVAVGKVRPGNTGAFAPLA